MDVRWPGRHRKGSRWPLRITTTVKSEKPSAGHQAQGVADGEAETKVSLPCIVSEDVFMRFVALCAERGVSPAIASGSLVKLFMSMKSVDRERHAGYPGNE
jgi:hypothetical protein